jgi:hypothetical protein
VSGRRTDRTGPGWAGKAAWIGVGVLALGGCATGGPAPQAAPPPCPSALILEGAERTSVYRAGAEARPADLRYLAVLTDLTSTCSYGDEGVDVALSFKVIAERGPAILAPEEVTYFVATVGPDGGILARDSLGGDLPFIGDEERVGLAEDLTLRLPSVTPAAGANYTLYVGFELDEAELARRRQPLLR